MLLQILLLAVLYVASLFLAWSWSVRLFRLHCQVSAAAHATKFYLAKGFPQVWPFNWEVLKSWAEQSLSSSDLHYLMVCMMFAQEQSFFTIMISPTVLAAYHFAVYAKRLFGDTKRWKLIAEPFYVQLMSRQVRSRTFFLQLRITYRLTSMQQTQHEYLSKNRLLYGRIRYVEAR